MNPDFPSPRWAFSSGGPATFLPKELLPLCVPETHIPGLSSGVCVSVCYCSLYVKLIFKKKDKVFTHNIGPLNENSIDDRQTA